MWVLVPPSNPPAPYVLVVDDDDAIRTSLIEILEEEGYATRQARNGIEALHVLGAAGKPRLILLDLMMPLMDGASFRGELLKVPAWKDIPVVVITAQRTPIPLAGQVNTVLKKPFELSDLLDEVGRLWRSGPAFH